MSTKTEVWSKGKQVRAIRVFTNESGSFRGICSVLRVYAKDNTDFFPGKCGTLKLTFESLHATSGREVWKHDITPNEAAMIIDRFRFSCWNKGFTKVGVYEH